ncbi:MAG: hypothetical protein U9N34_02140, partial [Candidatus Cloacimonadota bacterium]|nr:hypothetical protein [Candidatus Cloacimonadota bacterium]
SLHQILTKGSLVKIATDHQEYSKWIMNKFEETNKFAPIFKKGFTKKPYSGHIETYFEQKKRQEGFPPIFMHFRKV